MYLAFKFSFISFMHLDLFSLFSFYFRRNNFILFLFMLFLFITVLAPFFLFYFLFFYFFYFLFFIFVFKFLVSGLV